MSARSAPGWYSFGIDTRSEPRMSSAGGEMGESGDVGESGEMGA
jgi:hypothetical protein